MSFSGYIIIFCVYTTKPLLINRNRYPSKKQKLIQYTYLGHLLNSLFFWFKVTPKTTIEWGKKQEKVMMMIQNWMVAHATKQQQQLRRLKITTHRVIVATFLFSISFFLFSPKIPRSPTHHQFADLRNLLGKTNFTFYLILW